MLPAEESDRIIPRMVAAPGFISVLYPAGFFYGLHTYIAPEIIITRVL